MIVIIWCLLPYSTVFQLVSATIHDFLEFFPHLLRAIFFQSHLLLSHILIVKTMDSSERGMNPVWMTIINILKEYWPIWGSNQQSPVLRSCALRTELWDSEQYFKKPFFWEVLKIWDCGVNGLKRGWWWPCIALLAQIDVHALKSLTHFYNILH